MKRESRHRVDIAFTTRRVPEPYLSVQRSQHVAATGLNMMGATTWLLTAEAGLNQHYAMINMTIDRSYLNILINIANIRH